MDTPTKSALPSPTGSSDPLPDSETNEAPSKPRGSFHFYRGITAAEYAANPELLPKKPWYDFED